MGLRRLVSVLVVCTLGALTVSATTVTAEEPSTHAAASGRTPSEVEAYWTPERIRDAKPPVPPKVDTTAAAPGPDGESISIPGSPPAGVTARGTLTATGRLYYTTSAGDYVCTATVIASNNKSVIATARHCGFNDRGTNYAFAPGFSQGNAPLGLWTMRYASWPTGGDHVAHDYAFLVMWPKDGRYLADAAGSNGIAFNYSSNYYTYVMGIPGATGVYTWCEGNGYDGSSWQRRLDGCGLTGGASGGSWNILWQSAGWAYQIGTYYGGYPNAMYGSYFGNDAYNIFTTAQNL